MYRLQNGVVSQVPASGVAPDGRSISGFLPDYISAMPACERQALGFYRWQVSDEAITEPTADPIADCIRVPVPSVVDPKTQRFEVSKRRLADWFDSLGVWESVSAYIQSDAKRARTWELAQCLDSDDPMIVAAIAELGQALGMTPAQMLDGLWACRTEEI